MSVKINTENNPHLANSDLCNIVIDIDGEKHMFYSALQAYTYLTTDDEERQLSVSRCKDQSKIAHYFSQPKSGYDDPMDIKAMKRVLLAKFMHGHPYYRELLLATEDKELKVIDKYHKQWDVGLSKLLTGLRNALRTADGEQPKRKLKSDSSSKPEKKVKKKKPVTTEAKPKSKVKKKSTTEKSKAPKGHGLNRRSRPTRRGSK